MTTYRITLYLKDRTLSGIQFWREEDVDDFRQVACLMSNYIKMEVTKE